MPGGKSVGPGVLPTMWHAADAGRAASVDAGRHTCDDSARRASARALDDAGEYARAFGGTIGAEFEVAFAAIGDDLQQSCASEKLDRDSQ